MGEIRRVAVIVGSLRRDSINRKIAKVMESVAPHSLNFHFVEIADLPHFNEDHEAAPPIQWLSFRRQIAEADAVLFVTPEYNRSIPGALKNAIDVGSRPYGQSVWAGKPAAIVTVTQGAVGGFGANHHLRQSLVFLDMPTLAQPEVYIGGAHLLFDHDGKLVQESTLSFLRSVVSAFAELIERVSLPKARAAA